MFNQLIQWSNKNYSYLPWRAKRSAYNTLVSEIMLQQTTVSTVQNHFSRFISKYPTIQALAKISEDDILRDWKGLGYYRRARNLLRAAKTITTEFEGNIPRDFDLLKSIHGIGDYTANALLGIGLNQRAIALDANLERVLSRFYGIKEYKGPKLQQEIYRRFTKNEICNEIDTVGGRAYNEALMDLGRSVCKARSASCEICALNIECVALNEGNALGYPLMKEVVSQKQFDLKLLRVLVETEKSILVYKKSAKEWLSGQYELPTFVLSSEEENFKQYPHVKYDEFYLLPSFRTAITKYKIENYVIIMSEKEFKVFKDKPYESLSLEGVNMSTACEKTIAKLEE